MNDMAQVTFDSTIDDDRRIVVYDGLYDSDDIDNFARVISQLDYEPRESFDNELNCGIERSAFKSAPFLYPEFSQLLEEHRGDFSITADSVALSHVYASAVRAGDSLSCHEDHPSPQSVSFLYYGNAFWKRDWGGETIFYDGREEAVAAVIPRPGRLAMFHSNISHRGGSPHPNAPVLRYTIAAFFYPNCAHLDDEVKSAAE